MDQSDLKEIWDAMLVIVEIFEKNGFKLKQEDGMRGGVDNNGQHAVEDDRQDAVEGDGRGAVGNGGQGAEEDQDIYGQSGHLITCYRYHLELNFIRSSIRGFIMAGPFEITCYSRLSWPDIREEVRNRIVLATKRGKFIGKLNSFVDEGISTIRIDDVVLNSRDTKQVSVYLDKIIPSSGFLLHYFTWEK